MKKLQLICMIILLCTCNHTFAQNAEPISGVETDSSMFIPLDEISYFLFADEAPGFSIVKNNGVIISGIQTITFKDILTSVESVENDTPQLSVFPNPVASRLTLQGLHEDTLARIFSLDGSLLIETSVTAGCGHIDVTTLPTGMYMLQVNDTTIKFIKK